ncbi:hypothetical protein GA0074695_1913 [Micromonospora viridifaciens]|uniref:Uncharacterized protein n=1 Tax=Micromonospora viridifaciens TaxID=1881 RepID=A0A1C4VYJ4_MICVI|nr:hypothetical protein [Micromonospora viridifaciens]SCE88851.1 hypothetical protein GA0074695_1913 [Micromonospora viridifaciens]
MSGQLVRCERHDSEQGSEFRIVDVVDELVPAVRKAAFVERGGHWSKSFPAGTPHLDRAWANFQRLIVPWLRQAADLDPVPWQEALDAVCHRLTGAGVDWWLTGSAALAVRGVAVTPGDLDLVVSAADARRVGDLLVDGLVEPVAPANWFCEWWGRAVLGARVEWVGGVGPAADQPEPSDFGLLAASQLQLLTWRGWRIRVPPLALQRAVSVRRGLHDRVRLIDGFAA